MMKRLPGLFLSRIKESFGGTRLNWVRSGLILMFLSIAWGASAQTLVWSDTFEHGKAPGLDQCEKWASFLDQLQGKSFVSVTISGTFDMAGKTLNDPVAATQLAALLSSRTPGTVGPAGSRWSVTDCFVSACGLPSVALSYNGNETQCECTDGYAIRPHSVTADWGGINVGYSCGAASQMMRLEFNSGVSITTSGPTTLCNGGSVVLSANSQVCSAPVTYRWNNGATTPSITVTEPGDYQVAIQGANGCGGISEMVSVTKTDVSVSAGNDAVYCQEPVQLNAAGASTTGSGHSVVNEFCIYNSPGGIQEDCVFNTDVCLEGSTFIGSSSYSTSVSLSNPTELRYRIFYSAFAATTFRVKLNNQELDSFEETLLTGACDTKTAGQFPRSFVLTEAQFKDYWIDGGANELRVEIETPANGLLLAGITAEVVTSNETYSWSPLAGLNNASIKNPIATPLTTTVYTVTYTDANGCSATDDVKVTVNCDPEPVAVCNPLTKVVGANCQASAAAAEFDGGSTGAGLSYSVTPAGPYAVGETEVIFTITDSHGKTSSCTTSITVTNDAPVISSVTASASSVAVDTPVVLTTTYSDNNVKNATINWGDLSTPEVINGPSETFQSTHIYGAAGTYPVVVAIADQCGMTTEFVYESITVYDNRSGSVNGGGWYDSPRGSHRDYLKTSGKVNFNFKAEYKRGSNVPQGHLMLNFHACNLKFRGSEFSSLVIDGETAVLAGTGSLNNRDGYKFVIGMVDDDTKQNDKKDKSNKDKSRKDKPDNDKGSKKHDRIRVKIWDPYGSVIYDTQPGEANDAIASIKIGGGNIEINNSGYDVFEDLDEMLDAYFGSESTAVYPNPFVDYLNVKFNATSKGDVLIQLMDLSGRIVASAVSPVREDGYYSLDVPEHAKNGIYLLTITQGKRVEVLRLVRK